jgi:putative membrane protein
MTAAGSNPTSGKFEVRPTASDHFAWIRTRLSIERTLMAWVRTAVSLIGFGFTIVQFFDRMQDLPGAAPARFPGAPRYLGLMLITCGIAALVISTRQYVAGLRYMRSGSFALIAAYDKEPALSPIIAVCIALIGVGLFAFFAVILRLL